MPTADVTVVIAHYEDAANLARALASVAGQSLQVREIIVVDDASSLDQRAAAQEAIRLVPRSTLIVLPSNQGPATARNAGWAMAQGTWVAFLDSDEVWHREKVALQMRAITTTDRAPALVATEVAQLRHDEEHELFTCAVLTAADARAARVRRRHLLIRNPFPTSSVMVRRDLGSRFIDGARHCEDYDLWLRLAHEDGLMLKVGVPLVARFKYPFGHVGLSRDVRAMMRGEANGFRRAKDQGAITPFEWAIATGVMVLRFTRQGLLHAWRTKQGYPSR